jgi:hypothetical protein
MGVDTTFQPKTPTYAVDSTATVTIDGRQDGVSSWRIRAVSAANQVKWAQGATIPTAAVVPAVGTIAPNQLGVNLGQTLYIEGIGAWLTFIGGGLFATTGGLEITGGQGGCGG